LAPFGSETICTDCFGRETFEWDAHPEQSRKQTTKIAKDAKLERTIEGSMLFALSNCKGFVSQFVRES